MTEKLKAVKKNRRELHTLPTGRFTLERKELLEVENAALTEYYAEWLVAMTGEEVSAENILEDLSNGVTLLKLVSRVEGSGVKDIHDVKTSAEHTQIFKGRDNMVMFQDSCRRLGIYDTVTSADLLEGSVSKLISVLVQLEEIYEEDGIEPLFGAVVPEAPEEAQDLRKSMRKSRRRSSKRSSRRSIREKPAADPLQEFIEKIKAMCGCGKKTVVE